MEIKKTIACAVCKSKDTLENPAIFVLASKDDETYICDSCIECAHQAIVEEKEKSNTSTISQSAPKESLLNTPKELYQELSKNVIGQDDAKKKISIAIAQHQRRMTNPSIKKSNILMIGPTGTGKTELARSIATFLKIPFVMTDATNLTTRGYVGEDVESVVARLLSSVNYDVSAAQKGIIFIDEIDKLGKSQNADSGVNTTAVQQELLKIIEGSNIKVKIKSPYGNEEFFVNTTNILFICSGAFEGLKSKPSMTMGISSVPQFDDNEEINTRDLTKFGLIPEFIGRFSVVAETKTLSESDLVRILTEPVNSLIKQKEKLFMIDNVKLEFDSQFLQAVAKLALSENTGARGLQKIIEKKLEKFYFDIDSYKNKTIIINDKLDIIKNNLDEENNQKLAS